MFVMRFNSSGNFQSKITRQSSNHLKITLASLYLVSTLQFLIFLINQGIESTINVDRFRASVLLHVSCLISCVCCSQLMGSGHIYWAMPFQQIFDYFIHFLRIMLITLSYFLSHSFRCMKYCLPNLNPHL
jgi:hypothetical protein